MAEQATANAQPPTAVTADTRTTRTKLREVVGFFVAAAGLIALVLVVLIAINSLPAAQKGQNVVALATSAFGVIGAIVGAYFGIRTASSAVEQLGQTDTKTSGHV